MILDLLGGLATVFKAIFELAAELLPVIFLLGVLTYVIFVGRRLHLNARQKQRHLILGAAFSGISLVISLALLLWNLHLL